MALWNPAEASFSSKIKKSTPVKQKKKKTWEQTKYSPLEDWTQIMCYNHNIE